MPQFKHLLCYLCLVIILFNLFEVETLCNIINIFTVTFDQLIVSLLNKVLSLTHPKPNFYTVVKLPLKNI